MHAHRVSGDRLVRRQHHEAVRDRLADKHPVERVLVQGGQLGKLHDGFLVQRKRLDAVQLALPGQEAVGRPGQFDAALRTALTNAYDAEIRFADQQLGLLLDNKKTGAISCPCFPLQSV